MVLTEVWPAMAPDSPRVVTPEIAPAAGAQFTTVEVLETETGEEIVVTIANSISVTFVSAAAPTAAAAPETIARDGAALVFSTEDSGAPPPAAAETAAAPVEEYETIQISKTISLSYVKPAVAAASASATEGEITIAASALPKLSECPTVPDDVHTPRGVSFGSMRSASLPLRGESPA